jgi:hypothetical protein
LIWRRPNQQWIEVNELYGRPNLAAVSSDTTKSPNSDGKLTEIPTTAFCSASPCTDRSKSAVHFSNLGNGSLVMNKSFSVFLDRLAERFTAILAGVVSSRVESLRAEAQAEQQSQLEDLARKYEADGKLQSQKHFASALCS